MESLTYAELLEHAKEAAVTESEWHHHYLPPNCVLNNTDAHQLILETENGNFLSVFDNKPMAELEQLEDLFFKRT